MSTSRITKLALIATATLAATIGWAGIAHADDDNGVLSPSGDILCVMGDSVPGSGGLRIWRGSRFAINESCCTLGDLVLFGKCCSGVFGGDDRP